MRTVFNVVTEAILWPFGIRRKRCAPREHDKDNGESEPLPEDGEGWEVHKINLFGAIMGTFLAWWALRGLKALPSTPTTAAPNNGVVSPVVNTLPRIPLSEFLRLLRTGAVTAVTYMADRPPAGSLVVKAMLPVAIAHASPLAIVSGSGFATPPSCPSSAETLLLPGCHQSLFEELRKTEGVRIECADVSGDAEPLINKMSFLLDASCLLASVAALVYLLRGSGQGFFSGRDLGDAMPDKDQRPVVTFEDVAGMENTKEELNEVIGFLRHPKSFYALGAHPPRGILLTGPSGTGKTLLARAVAGEAGVPFLYSSSAAFVEIYVGQGAQRIRQFFEQARSCAPCIVFLDELDAVGAARTMVATGGNQEYAQTLNQLLLELDGIESHSPAIEGGVQKPPVVVTMAATNRYDCLDEALVRPGRLDRIVMVGLPNLAERMATLKIHARKLNTENLDFEALARRTEGRSGADLANLLNEAALLAARRRADAVRMEHLFEVLGNPRPVQRSQATFANQGEGSWLPPDSNERCNGYDIGRSDTGFVFQPELCAQMLATMAATMATGGHIHRTPHSTTGMEGVD